MRRSSDRLNFIITIPIPVRRRLLSEYRPRCGTCFIVSEAIVWQMDQQSKGNKRVFTMPWHYCPYSSRVVVRDENSPFIRLILDLLHFCTCFPLDRTQDIWRKHNVIFVACNNHMFPGRPFYSSIPYGCRVICVWSEVINMVDVTVSYNNSPPSPAAPPPPPPPCGCHQGVTGVLLTTASWTT